MKKSTRFLSMLLSIVMILGLVPMSVFAANADGFDYFGKRNTYKSDTFADVNQNNWFYDNVKKAYELGLMIGKGEKFFDTDSNVTLAETITIAARLNLIYTTGGDEFGSSTPWYQAYAEYAYANGIIDSLNMPMNDAATRSEFASILAAALPDEALEAINKVADNAISDVSVQDDYGTAVYKLYRAGILTGNDAVGTFNPKREISRAEVAAIVTRMAEPSLRKSVTLGQEYTVTFDLDGGKTETAVVFEGDTVEEPKNPSRIGYNFDDWYTEKNGGVKFDFNTPITADTTIYAHWTYNAAWWQFWNGMFSEKDEKEPQKPEKPDEPVDPVDPNPPEDPFDPNAPVDWEQSWEKQDKELERIAKINGGELPEIYMDEEDFIPSTIVGKFSDVKVTDYDSAKRALKDIENLMMIDDVDAEFVGSSTNDYGGNITYRLQQMYKGVQVYGKQLLVTTDEDGNITSLNGDYDPLNGMMDEAINLTVEEAYPYAAAEYADVDPAGTLVVYTVEEGYNEYAYHFSGSGEVYISAVDGKVLLSYSNVNTARVTNYTATTGRGFDSADGTTYTIDTVYDNDTDQYVFYDSTRNIYYMDAGNQNTDWNTYYYMSFLNDDDNVWDNSISEGVILYQNLSDVYDFYLEKLGIRSFDNANGEVRAYVNDGSHNGTNACNSGPLWTTLDGDKFVTLLRFGRDAEYHTCVDAIGHEFTHAIQGSLSNSYDKDTHELISILSYSGETGALMEAYSDFMGILIELWRDDSTDWKAIKSRDIKNPSSTDTPSVYKGVNWYSGDDDSAFVHHNSTVIAHAIYCMYMDGINDISKLSELLYRTWGRLPTTPNFKSYYQAMITAASEMNFSSDEFEIIKNVFEAANIIATKYESPSLTSKIIVFSIKDKNTGEPVKNAAVSFMGRLMGTLIYADPNNGTCSVKIAQGTYRLMITAPGYASYSQTVYLINDTQLSIDLTPSSGGSSGGTQEDSFTLTGSVFDAQSDNFVGSAKIELRKGYNVASGRILASTTSDSNGRFSFDNLECGYYTAFVYHEDYIACYETVLVQNSNLSGRDNYVILILTKALVSDDQIRIVLTWDENPRDLDSHLMGNKSDGSTFHVYFSDPTAYDTDSTVIAVLDIDDTSSYGPETITLDWEPGIEYDYFVHHYAGTGSLSSSGANIKIYSGSTLISNIPVPMGSGTDRYWNVFKLKDGRITMVDTFIDIQPSASAGVIS